MINKPKTYTINQQNDSPHFHKADYVSFIWSAIDNKTGKPIPEYDTEGWAHALNWLRGQYKQKQLPHFSILQDWYVVKAIIKSKEVFLLRDDANNIHVFGFYDCITGSIDKGCNVPAPVKMLYDTGILYKGVYPGLVKPTEIHFNRNTGEGWEIPTIDNLFVSTDADFGSLKMMFRLMLQSLNVGNSKTILDVMAYREAVGQSNAPFLYLIHDVIPKSTGSYMDDIVNAASVAVGALAVIAPALAVVTLLKQSISIAQSVSSFINTGIFTTKDLSLIADGLAATLLSDKDNVAGIAPETLSKLVKMGSDIYTGIDTGNYAPVAEVFGIDQNMAQDVVDSIKKSDIYKLVEQTSAPIAEVEKIVASYNNNEMVRSFMLESDRIITQAYTYNTALKSVPVQQMLINAVANTGAAQIIPGVVVGVQALVTNNSINTDEFKALTDFVQIRDIPQNSLNRLALSALVERARDFTGKNFVLPSNIPAYLQGAFAKQIEKELPGVKVISVVNESIGRINNFYPAFN